MLSHRILFDPDILIQHPKLPLGVGEAVNVLAERSHWLYGQALSTGRHGWFPKECVDEEKRQGLSSRIVRGYRKLNSMIG